MKSFGGVINIDYYLGLASEDYFSKLEEPPGKWCGSGVDIFDLHPQLNQTHGHKEKKSKDVNS